MGWVGLGQAGNLLLSMPKMAERTGEADPTPLLKCTSTQNQAAAAAISSQTAPPCTHPLLQHLPGQRCKFPAFFITQSSHTLHRSATLEDHVRREPRAEKEKLRSRTSGPGQPSVAQHVDISEQLSQTDACSCSSALHCSLKAGVKVQSLGV